MIPGVSDIPVPATATQDAVVLLRDLGAAGIDHPGGTLLAHLLRVEERLAAWGARPALRLAGLCHAFYGTDGFPAALLPPGRRSELAAVIGTEAEALVYLYGSCDRKATYPALADAGAPFHDRFTGRAVAPGPGAREDFAELTAANELDLAVVDPSFREEWGAGLLGLFTRFRPLLTGPAWETCESVLGGAAG